MLLFPVVLFALMLTTRRAYCLLAPRVGLSARRMLSTMKMSRGSPEIEEYTSVFVKGALVGGQESAFYEHSLSNARNSILEPGIARFDLLRRIDLPAGATEEFLLVEVYRQVGAPEAHKATPHYNRWREAVGGMMARPREAAKFTTLFPPARQWTTSPAASGIESARYAEALPWSSAPFSSGAASGSASATSTPLYSDRALLAVVVHVHVAPGQHEAFVAASLLNCRSSLREGGVTRFDLLQDQADAGHFLLVEVYNSAEGPAAHKATPHYAAWAATVAPMMTQPRSAERYSTLYPPPLYWHTSAAATHPGEGASANSDGSTGLSCVTGHAFGFLSPKIAMGRGIAPTALKAALVELGVSRPFLVTGRTGMERHRPLLEAALGADYAHGSSPHFCVGGEPTVEDAQKATQLAIESGCDSVLGVGGGSAMDLGKAVSALMTNKGDIMEYMEVIGRGKAIQQPPVPFIAVPTTAGTGSEVTKNAVLKSAVHGRKASMRHDWMLPRVAIVDPLLTISCPADVTAHVGLDTLCQVIEPFTSNAANPFTDALAKEAILRAARSLRAVVADGSNIEAREDLSVASVMGGLALANAKLGAVHGYAAVLGGLFEVAPHGALCACLTPHVFRANAERLAEQAARGDAGSALAQARLDRFDEVARIVTGSSAATWAEGAAWLQALVRDTRVPGLKLLCGLKEDQIAEVARATSEASSTKGNPVVLSLPDLEAILRRAM